MEKQIGEFSHVHVTEKMEKKIRTFSSGVNQENIWNLWWLSFPYYASMSEWTIYQVYRGLFMHSCFLSYEFYEFKLYPVSDSASTKNSQQHIPSDVDGYKFKTTCRLNVISQLSLINLLI